MKKILAIILAFVPFSLFAQPTPPASGSLTVNSSTGAIIGPVTAAQFKSANSISSGGTVTNFSAGNLSPLFTTSVANSTTTPALSFSLSNAAQNAVLAGPGTGGTGAPTYRALVAADIPDLSGTYQPLSSVLTSWAAITRASGFDTFAATPSGANLASLLTTALPATKGGTGLTSLGTGVETALGNATNGTGGFLTTDGSATVTGKSIAGSQLTGAYTASGLTMGTSKLLGRTTASSGAAEEISVGSALSLSSGTLDRAALTGDVTASAGSNSVTVTKINGTSLAGLATGILKNTTSTGVPSIAVAGDFPTLNQNTTGTATNATNIGITDDTTTNATMYIVWVTANTGNLPAKVTSTKLSYNPSTGTLTVSGSITVTGAATIGTDSIVAATSANANLALDSQGGSGRQWVLSSRTAGTYVIRDATGGTDIVTVATTGQTIAGNLTLSGTSLITKPGGTIPIFTTNTAITSGAGAQIGTLTNSPTAGNPTKWIPINDNGTTRYIPAW